MKITGVGCAIAAGPGLSATLLAESGWLGFTGSSPVIS